MTDSTGDAALQTVKAGIGDGDDLADRVAAAVAAVPGVARLHAGAFGEVATYLPGRSVAGLRMQPELTEVHLVVEAGADIREVAGAVRTVVLSVVPGTPVDIFVEDVDTASFDVAAALTSSAGPGGAGSGD